MCQQQSLVPLIRNAPLGPKEDGLLAALVRVKRTFADVRRFKSRAEFGFAPPLRPISRANPIHQPRGGQEDQSGLPVTSMLTGGSWMSPV